MRCNFCYKRETFHFKGEENSEHNFEILFSLPSEMKDDKTTLQSH